MKQVLLAPFNAALYLINGLTYNPETLSKGEVMACLVIWAGLITAVSLTVASIVKS